MGVKYLVFEKDNETYDYKTLEIGHGGYGPIYPTQDKVRGYNGFWVEYLFNEDDSFLRMGIWE